MHRLALVLVALVGLSLAGTRGSAAAACHSTCTAQLAECKRTCPGGGQARRDCRAACAERSTCTAPGAEIRTLAYVVSECATDPQGQRGSGLKQKLLIRRGNCDPVTVIETAPSPPMPEFGGLCSFWGMTRLGSVSPLEGAFQRLAVLPDGSGVVFEVSRQFSLIPPLGPEAPEEGIYFVRADGSRLRRLGPASRVPVLHRTYDPRNAFGISIEPTGNFFPVSPNGRSIALLDLGPDTAGHEAPQIFLLDLRSGRRTQLTHLSLVPTGIDPGLSFPSFRDNRTVVFGAGLSDLGTFKTFQIKTDGSGLKEIPAPALSSGAHIVQQFTVSGARTYVALVDLPDKQPVNPPPDHVVELFLVDGKNLVQLTNFGRSDTGGLGPGTGFITRGRVIFLASANPTGENPDRTCQFFSVNERGGDLRQLTHLPADRPSDNCIPAVTGFECTVDLPFQAPDEVTGTVVFLSSCDPVGGNPHGEQLFAMRSDGTGLRPLTATRGLTTDPDGTVHVEMPGPWAYPASSH